MERRVAPPLESSVHARTDRLGYPSGSGAGPLLVAARALRDPCDKRKTGAHSVMGENPMTTPLTII